MRMTTTSRKTLESLIATCRLLATTRGTIVGLISHIELFQIDIENRIQIKACPVPGLYVGIWNMHGLILSQGTRSGHYLNDTWLSVADDIFRFAILESIAVETGEEHDGRQGQEVEEA